MKLDRITLDWHARRRGNWLLGCGIVLVIVVLLVAGGIVFVAMNARDWTASAMREGLTSVIQEAPITDEEKTETIAVVDGFVQDFRDGNVTFQQLGSVFEKIADSPVLPAGVAMGVGEMYFGKSELTEDKKAEGRKQIARVAHGLADGLLTEQDLQRAVEPIKAKATEQDALQFQISESVTIRLKNPEATTPEELSAFIDSARATADDGGVPQEPPAFDLSGELQKAIDIALGRRAPDAPAGDLPPGMPDDPIEPDTDPDAEPSEGP